MKKLAIILLLGFSTFFANAQVTPQWKALSGGILNFYPGKSPTGYDSLMYTGTLRGLFKLKGDSVNNNGYVTHGYLIAHGSGTSYSNGYGLNLTSFVFKVDSSIIKSKASAATDYANLVTSINNRITTNTTQTGLTGDKATSGVFKFNDGSAPDGMGRVNITLNSSGNHAYLGFTRSGNAAWGMGIDAATNGLLFGTGPGRNATATIDTPYMLIEVPSRKGHFYGNLAAVLPAYSSGTQLPVVYNSTTDRFETSTGGGVSYWPLGGNGSLTATNYINTGNQTLIIGNNTNNNYFSIQHASGVNAQVFLISKGTDYVGSIAQHSGNIGIGRTEIATGHEQSIGIGYNMIGSDSTKMIVRDEKNGKGLELDSTSSDTSKFTNWSYVNKKWVLDKISGSGVSGANIYNSDGTLTVSRVVNTNGNSIQFGDTSPTQTSGSLAIGNGFTQIGYDPYDSGFLGVKYYSELDFSKGAFDLYTINSQSGKERHLSFNADSTNTFRDDYGFALKYYADYSANFTSRSIPDVAYVLAHAGTTYTNGYGLLLTSNAFRVDSTVLKSKSSAAADYTNLVTSINTKGTGTVTTFGKTDGFGIVSSVANATTTPNHTIRVDTAHTTNGLMTFKFGASKGHVDSLFASTTINFSNQFKGNGGTLTIRVDSTQVQKAITLTTTGTSGAATFNQATGALNIPSYSGGGGSGTVTSITPGYGFTSSTPITTSGTLTIDTTKQQTVLNFFPKGDTRYAKIGSGITDPTTTSQDIIVRGTSTLGRLGKGADSTSIWVDPSTHLLAYHNPKIYLSSGSFSNGGTSATDTLFIKNSAVMTKLLTGYSASAGTVAGTDNILQAFNKTGGNIALKAPIASPTFTGVVTMPTPFTLGATSVTSTGTQLNYLNAATGTTGTTSTNLVYSTSPTITNLILAAGTTSLAPLKLTSGTDLTSAAAGNFEYNGTRLAFSPSTTRKRVLLSNDAAPSNGQIPIGNATDFTLATITGTANRVTVTNASGSITLSGPQDLNTTANVQFLHLGLGTSASGGTWLTTMPGTTSIAPIQLPAGTNVTTPVSGYFENDGSFAYYTNSSPARASLPATYATADLTAQTSAGNITTFTVGATTRTFNVSAYLNVTAVATDVIEVQVTYTDENSTSQTVNMFNMGATSALISTISNSTYPPVTIRAKNATTITVKTTLTTGAGTITFDCGARITQL